jgi:hypothetical protein
MRIPVNRVKIPKGKTLGRLGGGHVDPFRNYGDSMYESSTNIIRDFEFEPLTSSA